jgi:putative DNA primase/helicase
LLHTAKVFREKYADAIIIIAADNDQFTVAPVRNPGVVDAHKAAHAVGGLVAVPEFTDLSDERDDEGRLIDRPTDFNDAHQRPGYGEEFVRATINALLYPQVEDVSVPEVGDDTLTWAGEPQFPAEAAEVPRASTSRTQDDAADEAARELEVKLGFSVLGYIGETIYLMSHEKQQIIARDSFPPATLVQLADIQWWEMHFPGKSGPNANAAANFIIRTAHRRGFFDQDRRRKPGAWEDAGRHVFHHGDHLTVDGARVELHQIKSRYVYERDVALPAPSGTPMTDAEGQAIYDIAKRFSWEQTSSAALLVGWTFLAPLCGLLPWRPHIHPTGVAGNGKSSILNKLIKPLLGEKRGAILADGSSSAPGLRQRLKSRSMPVLMDEAEGNDEQARQNMGNMYALGRAMSSGDGFEIIKGSATHESHSFESRAMFCMAAINPSMENKADLDRFTQLTLRKSRGDKDAAAKWEQTRAMLHAIERDDGIAGRMVGRLVGMTREILANVAVFTKAAAAKFGNQRDGDQLGTMAAGCWCLTRSDVATEDQARAFLDHLDWTAQAEQDEIDDTQNALNHLMQTLIRVDGRELAMRELMEIALGGKVDGSDVRAPRARAELCRHGIAINATGVDASMFALSNSSKALKALLEGTQAGNNPGRAFANLAGAIKTSRDDKVKFGGGPTQAVLVPLKLIGLDHVQRLADEVGAVRIGYEDSRHLSAEEEEGYAISQGMFGGMPSSTRRQ